MFNFSALFVVGTAVAKSVAAGFIDLNVVDANVILGGLLGAITWNLITWYFGLPSSSSHALIGGLVGSALAAGVFVNWQTVIDKVAIPMVLSPLVAFSLGFGVMLLIMWIFRKKSPSKVGQGFRLAQTLSAAAMALGHGLQR